MVGAVMSGHMTKPGKISPFYCCQEDVFFFCVSKRGPGLAQVKWER